MSRIPEGLQNGTSAPGATTGGGAGAGAGAGAGTTGVRDSLVGKIVCPFCGQQKSASSEPCPRCTMEDTPATRQATKARIGPWYVLQNRSPSAPGMKYATLLWLVNKGHVTPRSVVRGPTTYQLWRYAAHVRGLSREFGLCYSCGGAVQKSDHLCPHCERPQDPPVDPDVLLDVRDGAGGLRAPVMREIDPRATRDVRAATESRRTPPIVEKYDAPEHEEHDDRDAREEIEEDAAAAAVVAEPSHGDRLRVHNDMIVRPKPNQELARQIIGGGRMVSATNLAAALQDPADTDAPEATRRWSALNVVLFLLLLIGGAAAAVLYLKPEYRQPTARWVGDTWSSVRNKLASMQWSSPPGEPPAPRVASKPASQPKPLVVTNVPPAPQPQPQPQTQPAMQVAKSDPPIVERKVEPKVEPKEEPKPQPQLARDTTPPHTKAPDPKEQPPQVTRKPDERPADPAADARAKPKQQQAAAPAEPEPPSLDQALDESRKLYRQGIDAEARNDYAAALRFYEQIKKLRREAWPGDLQVRIDLAREEVKARSAKSE